MNVQILSFFLILLVLSLYPILAAHRLYNKYGHDFYLNFLFYDALAKVFFFLNFFGRYLVDLVLSDHSTSQHSRIMVALLLNFIAYPFFAASTYFFVVFISGLGQKKLPQTFSRIYMGLQSSAMILFVFLIKTAKDRKIETWNTLKGDIGIIAIHIIYLLIFLFSISRLLFSIRSLDNREKKTKLNILGLYYLIVYSVLFSYLLIIQTRFHIPNPILDLILIVFNIPAAFFLKHHISRYYKMPSLESIQGIQNYFDFHGITQREAEIIDLISKGKSNQEISDILFLSLQTIKNATSVIFKKTGVKSRAGLIHSIFHPREL